MILYSSYLDISNVAQYIFYDAISVGATPRRLLSQLRNPAAARPVYGFLFFTKFPSNPAKNLLII